MSNALAGVIVLAGAAAIYFSIRILIALAKKLPIESFAKKLVASVAVGIVAFVVFGVTQSPEERAAILAQKGTRDKSEQASKAGQEARDAARRQMKTPEQKSADMVNEITTGWDLSTTDADNDKTNPQKAAKLIMKYPDYIHNAPENWIDAEDALKKPWAYYGKVVNLSGRIYSINQLPPDSSDARLFGGKCYHAMLAISEGFDPITVSMHIVGDSSGIAEDSYINVKGYIFGHAQLVNRMGGGSRGLAFVGFNE